MVFSMRFYIILCVICSSYFLYSISSIVAQLLISFVTSAYPCVASVTTSLIEKFLVVAFSFVPTLGTDVPNNRSPDFGVPIG